MDDPEEFQEQPEPNPLHEPPKEEVPNEDENANANEEEEQE